MFILTTESLDDQLNDDEMAGANGTHGRMVEESEERPERLRRREEDNIKIYLSKPGWEDVDLIRLALD